MPDKWKEKGTLYFHEKCNFGYEKNTPLFFEVGRDNPERAFVMTNEKLNFCPWCGERMEGTI